MDYIGCTMYEGHYHYGVAVLINSLFSQGYRGTFYVAYKGELPIWVEEKTVDNSISETKKQVTYKPHKDLNIIFLKEETTIHFSNYKPQFMKYITDRHPKCKSVFYFDPDIVVHEQWQVFCDWAGSGVAVSEDVNSPIQKFHPKRIKWRSIYSEHGQTLTFKSPIYVNSGFLGLNHRNFDFLDYWIKSLEIVAPHIGGLDKASFKGSNHIAEAMRSDYFPFSKTDQDALNAALEMYTGPISFMGKEGMTFGPGPRLMSHALGEKKPWLYKPLMEIVNGAAPRTVDKDFWEYAQTPIKAFNNATVKKKKKLIKLASLIGRFYSRN